MLPLCSARLDSDNNEFDLSEIEIKNNEYKEKINICINHMKNHVYEHIIFKNGDQSM